MKKMHKSAILALPLVSFNIPALTNWVKRPERHMEDMLKLIRSRKDIPSENLENELQECRVAFQKEIDAQPKTVGDLIKTNTYRFADGEVNGYDAKLVKSYVDRFEAWHIHCGGAKIGKKTIADIKQKLIDLGLTPDDWPALVPHDQILERLSKQGILKVLAKEIFPTLERFELKAYIITAGWTEEEGQTKTVRDLIQFDPSKLPDEQTGHTSYVNRQRFFFERKRFFVRLRHELVKKGLGVKDGKFFTWDPNPGSLSEAMQVLKKHKLNPSEIRKFAKIVVAERWVI